MQTIRNKNHSHEIEVLRKFYEALNRNEISQILQYLHSQIERIEPEGFSSSGVYKGLTELEAHLSKSRGTWAEGSCEPERYLSAGDNIIVSLHVRVRLKDKSDWIEGHIADLFTFKDGKIIEMRTFLNNHEALEWANTANK